MDSRPPYCEPIECFAYFFWTQNLMCSFFFPNDSGLIMYTQPQFRHVSMICCGEFCSALKLFWSQISHLISFLKWSLRKLFRSESSSKLIVCSDIVFPSYVLQLLRLFSSNCRFNGYLYNYLFKN